MQSQTKEPNSFLSYIFNFKYAFSFALIILITLTVGFAYLNSSHKYSQNSKYILASGKLQYINNIDTPGSYIPFDKTLTTPKAVIEYKHNIILNFNNATFKLYSNKLRLQSGKVNVEIPVKGTNFKVITPNAQFKVIGTKFEVKYSVNSYLKVFQGKVWVNTISNKTFMATKGESACINNKGDIVKLQIPENVALKLINYL